MRMFSISIQSVHSGHEFIFQRNSNMLLFDRNNETRIFLWAEKKNFGDLSAISFLGSQSILQLFARTFFSIVYNFVKN